MEITELLNFTIAEDHIQSMKTAFYFFHINPPNFTTLDMHDKERHRINFENTLRNIEEMSISILAIDKTVNLDANREYISQMKTQFDFIKNAILHSINNLETTRGNTECSYYFVVKCKNQTEVQHLQSIFKSNNFSTYIAKRDELISIMRGFLLREFIDGKLYVEEESYEEEI